jgi:hypothetical protein
MTRRPGIGLVVLLALGAGCGGGTSTEDYAEDANAICRQISESLALATPARADTPRKFDKQVQVAIERTRTEISSLKELDRPDGADGDTAGKFVASLEGELEDTIYPALRNWADGLLQHDPAKIRKGVFALRALQAAPQQSARYAKALEADDCASG